MIELMNIVCNKS